jgi:Spy/CpxP family protein refolding chaperone
MMRCLLASLFLAGLVSAQQAPPARPRGPGLGGPMSERRLTRLLNLNSEQQNKVHTAIEESRVMLQGTDQREREVRGQLATAVKSGDEAGIDRISQDLAAIRQQRTAVQAKTMAKIYASLNADQKALMERPLNRSLGVPGPRLRGPRPAQQ